MELLKSFSRDQLILSAATLLSIYFALIAFHGYRFGDEDMSETLSYALYLHDMSLYPKDLYIQAVGPNPLNERFPFTMLLYIFGKDLSWPSFFLHFGSTMLLLSGMLQLANKFLKYWLSKIAFLVISLFVLYNLTLGGNEIWYNYFVPSHLAKSIAIWAIVFWVNDKPLKAYGILVLATLAQPVVGAQLALLFLLVDLFQKLRFNPFDFSPLKGPLLFGFTAGVWILFVFSSHVLTDHSVTSKEFYDIMEARLAHHFFPSYYPLKSWLLLIPCFIAGALLWRDRCEKLYLLFLWAFAFMVVYVVAIEYLEWPSLLSLQWFKTTVWLKPLSILVILAFIEKYTSQLPKTIPTLAIVLITGCSFLQLLGILEFAKGKPYHFPGTNYYTPEMQMSLEIKKNLPQDICLITGPEITGVRYFSQRSIYVDYKSNIHSKTYMSEAAQRRHELYDLSLSLRRSKKDVVQMGKLHYAGLNASDFQTFTASGATHVMTDHQHQLDLPIALQTPSFTIYKL